MEESSSFCLIEILFILFILILSAHFYLPVFERLDQVVKHSCLVFRKIPGSNLDLEVSYPDGFFVAFLRPSRKMPR
jgi:hypothetical protein